MYSRKELIAHELAHVGRMMYEEPQFEELFAYQSSSHWRRWMGPIVTSFKETLLFFCLLLLGLLSTFISGWEWGILAPFFLVCLGIGRVCLRHRTYKKCLCRLEETFSIETARHLTYRLLDKEITLFSTLAPTKIREKIEEWAKQSFRWYFLQSIYVHNNK